MKNKLFLLTAIAFALGIAITSCNKNEIEQKDPKITDENVTVTANSATFTWTVEWVGKRVSVVELSQHEDMSDSQFYGSEEELNKSEFVVTVNDLQPSTQYYYRFWVWNQSYVDNKFVMGTKHFTTSIVLPSPIGAINGMFSVSDEKRVWFSKGNLQFIGSASTDYWKFAENQWNVFGNNGQGSSYNYKDRDLFGWGTSGYHHGNDSYNRCYSPYNSISTSSYSSSYNKFGYGPSTNMSNPNIAGTQYDWGVHNKVYNGGNWVGLWRTLTSEEWDYVLNERKTHTVNGVSDARFAKGRVNGVYGVILFPDDYSHPSEVPAPVGINDRGNTGWNNNVFGESEWALMEAKGCVFLPAAGQRSGTSVYFVGTYGVYWSASYYDSSCAYSMSFNDSDLNSQRYYYRYFGFAVRLVRSVQ